MSEANRVLAPYTQHLSVPLERAAADLTRFAELLLKWNATQNLVSRETVDSLWDRHVADSLQLIPLIEAVESRLWRDISSAKAMQNVLDLGSGGGLPALPLAIASRGLPRHFTCLEPVGKKSAFLRAVARDLELPVTVQAVRAEALDSRETFALVTSRALAALPQLLAYAAPQLTAGATGLFHKGRDYAREVQQAAQLYDFDVVVHPSVTDAHGVVLEIANLRAKSVA